MYPKGKKQQTWIINVIQYNFHISPLIVHLDLYLPHGKVVALPADGQMKQKRKKFYASHVGKPHCLKGLSVLVRLSGWSCKSKFLKMWSQTDGSFTDHSSGNG